ncbi:TPA: DUF3825 domain-containing protein [Salmonella enterica subsp. salamae serovar 28:r:e,n,z15]|nr:DUF3825 domain-containing protein [Salmonella enterica subsp. salamae serovar 28:r:e,n,z15]
MSHWPEELFDLIYFPQRNDKLDALANLAENENWDYQSTTSDYPKPVLYNYLRFTYKRLREEGKIEISDDAQYLTFNTGLVTNNQEPIFLLCNVNRNSTSIPWFFIGWKRRGEQDLSKFSRLPEMANFFDDPQYLLFDSRKDLRVNIEHIVEENKERFPDPYNQMDNYPLQTLLKGAIDNAKERVKRNYKTAIPQYYDGKLQLLLPLCLNTPEVADLALVVEKQGNDFYRASTCLTLDMSYNNARLLARPDRDWLVP